MGGGAAVALRARPVDSRDPSAHRFARDTIRGALASDEAPRYARAPSGSKLDPFRDEIHRLLHDDPKLPGQRVRELIAQLG